MVKNLAVRVAGRYRQGRSTEALLAQFRSEHQQDMDAALAVLAKAARGLTKESGFQFSVKDDGVWGGDIGYAAWTASVAAKSNSDVRVQVRFRRQVKRDSYGGSDILVPSLRTTLELYLSQTYPASEVVLSKPLSLRDVKRMVSDNLEEIVDALGGPLKGKGNYAKLDIATVEKFIRDKTYTLDHREGDSVTFSTRDNGDIVNEHPGQEDIRHGVGLRKQIVTEFGQSRVNVSLQPVDEWVILSVRLTGR